MSPTSRTALKGIDRPRLDAIVEPIVRAHGAEVVDIEWKSDLGGWVLRIFVERLGSADNALSTEDAAVNLELCSNIARDLSPSLDVVDLIPHAYHLEVSSPGVERELRGAADFRRFEGKKAKLKFHDGVLVGTVKQKVVIGILGAVEGSELSIIDTATTHRVPLSDIASARLVFEFGPAPKPGKIGKGTSPSRTATSTKRSV